MVMLKSSKEIPTGNKAQVCNSLHDFSSSISNWLFLFLSESDFVVLLNYRGLKIYKENMSGCLIMLVAGAPKKHGGGVTERELAMCLQSKPTL